MKPIYLAILFALLSLTGSSQTVADAFSQENSIRFERVFPNPFVDHVYFELSSEKFSTVNVVLMDILGNPVQIWENLEVSPGTQRIRLSVKNDLHTGFYLLKVNCGSQNIVQRLKKV